MKRLTKPLRSEVVRFQRNCLLLSMREDVYQLWRKTVNAPKLKDDLRKSILSCLSLQLERIDEITSREWLTEEN